MMQDGKALQSGTSHFLGQNFAKAFEVTYLNKENKPEYVWATSWGVSTRLIGALIMTHSDDNGLVLPPRLAPIQVVIIPIATKPEQQEQVNNAVQPIIEKLRQAGISVKFDDADNKRPGFKFADYELKGVPVRLVLGARDLENGTIEVMRRDTLEKETRPIGARLRVRQLRGVQGAYQGRWLLPLPLGRHCRDRGQDQGRDAGHHPLRTVCLRADTGCRYGQRQAVKGARHHCPQLLNTVIFTIKKLSDFPTKPEMFFL